MAKTMLPRFSVFSNDFDDGVFILDATDKTSREKWLGIGFKENASKRARERYAQEICDLLNRPKT